MMKVIIILLSLILVSSQIMASSDDDSKEKKDPIPPGDPKPTGLQPDPPSVTPEDVPTTPKALVTSTKSPGGNSKPQSAPNSGIHRTAPMVAVFGTLLVNIVNLQRSML